MRHNLTLALIILASCYPFPPDDSGPLTAFDTFTTGEDSSATDAPTTTAVHNSSTGSTSTTGSTSEGTGGGSNDSKDPICIPPWPDPMPFLCLGRPRPAAPCFVLVDGCLKVSGGLFSCNAIAYKCDPDDIWVACGELADACDQIQPNPPECYDLVVACTCWSSVPPDEDNAR